MAGISVFLSLSLSLSLSLTLSLSHPLSLSPKDIGAQSGALITGAIL